jgi:ABC-type sugar transport system substrate-binding protein
MSRLGKIFGAALVGVAIIFGAMSMNSQAQADEVKVGIFSVNYNSPTIFRMIQQAKADAEALGWTVETHDGQGDQVATNNAANDFIRRGFDALINVASDNFQMTGVVKNANEAGTIFVSTFSGYVPGITADIGTNSIVDGAVATLELLNRTGRQGHIVFFNWNVLPALRDRTSGFKAALSDIENVKVTEIEVKVPGQVEDVYDQMTNLLAAHDDITGVVVGWDELASGAVRAIEQAGRGGDISVAGMDGIGPVFEMLRQGNRPYKLSVSYPVEKMGRKSVEVVKAALAGNMPDTPVLYIGACLVTASTVMPVDQESGISTYWDDCTPFSGNM